MRVLVTRPKASAEKTCKRLTALGHIGISVPLFTPVHRPDAIITAFDKRLWIAIAITSAEAVAAIIASGVLAKIAPIKVFAIGKSTANAALENGFSDVFVGPGDGRGLAEAIANTYRQDTREPLLYLAGKPRAPYFEARLEKRNIPCKTVECYAMKPLAIGPQAFQAKFETVAPDAILFYSKLSANRFFELEAAHPLISTEQPPKLMCISHAVAEAIPSHFSAHIRIATAPNEASLLALLS